MRRILLGLRTSLMAVALALMLSLFGDTRAQVGVSGSGGADISPLVLVDANTVHQRNGANLQELRVHASYTDDSNWAGIRLIGDVGSSRAKLAYDRAGTGAIRHLQIGTVTNTNLELIASNVLRASVSSLGLAINSGVLTLSSSTQAALPASANGSMVYCTNCNPDATCTAGGAGAFAFRIAGAWTCELN